MKLYIIIILILLYVMFRSNSDKTTFKDEVRYSQICEEEGILLLNSGNFQEALEKFNESARTRPSNFGGNSLYYYIAKCYFGLKEYEKVISSNNWRNKEEELYFKALSAIELKDLKKVKSYIYQGKKINYEKFELLKDDAFNIRNDVKDFFLFFDSGTIYQIVRNINENDLLNADVEVLQLLKKVKYAIRNPNSFNKLRELKPNDAYQVFKHVNLEKLFSKKYLYLNEKQLSGKYNNYNSHNKFFITDLSFIKYFTELQAVNLFGQTKLENWEILNALDKLVEINIGDTNLSALYFSEKKIIPKNNSKLQMFSEYESEKI